MHRKFYAVLLDPSAPAGGGGAQEAPTITPELMSDGLRSEIAGLAGDGEIQISDPMTRQDPPRAQPSGAPTAPKAPETPAAPTPDTKPDDILDRMTPKGVKKPETPKEAPKTTPAALGEPSTPADLRKAYQETKAKLEALEKAAPKSVDIEQDPKWKALTAEADRIKAEHKRVLDEYAALDYTKSPEFDANYRQPVQKAFTEALNVLKFVKIEDKDTGTQRAVTPEELRQIASLDDEARADKILEVFGSNALRIGPQIEKVASAFKALKSAHDEATQKGAKLFEERSQRVAQAQAEAIKDFDLKVESIMKGDPTLYEPLPDTDPDAATHNKDMADAKMLADLAFKPPAGTDPAKSRVAKAALVARSIAYERVNYLHNKATAKIAELEAKLAQYEKSEPGIGGDGGAGPGAATSSENGWENEIRGLVG